MHRCGRQIWFKHDLFSPSSLPLTDFVPDASASRSSGSPAPRSRETPPLAAMTSTDQPPSAFSPCLHETHRLLSTPSIC
jgi:hypothetical protein